MTRSDPDAAPTRTAQPDDGRAGELPPLVAGFLERLRRVPLGAWVEAGRRFEELDRRDRRARRTSGPDAPTAGVTVRWQLRQVMSEMPRVAAQTRRRVLDLAAMAQGFVHPADVSRMKKAALTAALALVARPALGEERFAQVYEPFATLIPLASLPATPPGAVPAAWSRGADASAPPAPRV